MNDLRRDAALLGGSVSRTQILCPGPCHSRDDRSLSLKASASSPIGYLFHSFAGDDPAECFAYIRERLGLPNYGVTPESVEFKAPVAAIAKEAGLKEANIRHTLLRMVLDGEIRKQGYGKYARV